MVKSQVIQTATRCICSSCQCMMSQRCSGKCCRAPWRLAVYYLQSKDERILPLLQAQLRFFEGQQLISAGYKLDGTAVADYSNIAFQAPVWCLFKVTLQSLFA